MNSLDHVTRSSSASSLALLRPVAVRLQAQVSAVAARAMACRIEDLTCLPHPLGRPDGCWELILGSCETRSR